MERSDGPSVSRGGRRSIGVGPIATSWKRGKSDRRSNDLDALTGLRFIAASCIVIAHLTATGYAPFGWRFDLAPAGMPLFFTLSGFIIHYVYSSDFAHAVPRSVHEFAVARFSRLYPLFAFLLLYHLLFSSLGKVLSGSPWILLSYATMTSSWWYWHIDGLTLIELPYGLSWSYRPRSFSMSPDVFGAPSHIRPAHHGWQRGGPGCILSARLHCCVPDRRWP